MLEVRKLMKISGIQMTKPTTIIEMDGLKICKNYVEEGLVHHTNDAEGLLSILYSSKINEIEIQMDQYEAAHFETFEKAVNTLFIMLRSLSEITALCDGNRNLLPFSINLFFNSNSLKISSRITVSI